MEWDDVRMFLAVARAGQFLAAARRLGVNHATVGRRITALEASLGATLVERRTTGCVLTPEGESFLAAAERMESEWFAARASIGAGDGAVTGTVRIGAPDGFGVAWLAPRLGALASRHPGLKLQLVPVPRAFSLSRREADIAITVERPEAGRLYARKLTDYALRLYASRAYVDTHGLPETAGDLARHRLVGHVEDLLFAPSLAYTSEIASDWDAAIEVSSALGQTEAVASGAGIGILHAFIAARHPGLVRALPDREIRRAYWLVIHENERAMPRMRAVAEFISDEVARDRAAFG